MAKNPTFKGKSFAFTGTLSSGERAGMAEVIEAEGGRVVDDVTAALDYLVVGHSFTPTAAQKKADRLNQKGASVQVIDEGQLQDLFRPTAEEALAMLRALPKGLARWQRLMESYSLNFARVDLSGADLRDLKLQGDRFKPISLERLKLDGADCRGATLVGVRLHEVRGANFDGADLRSSYVHRCEGCSFKGADMRDASVSAVKRCCFDGARLDTEPSGWGSFSDDIRDCSAVGVNLNGTRLNPANLSGSDFTGAQMRVRFAGYTVARGAVFKNADLRGAELDESKFARADFTGADLSEAVLHKSDFTGATLTGAKLVNADLRNARLVNADLSGADLSGANLADANLTGATIDRADFAGANLMGAKLDGPSLKKARNVTPEQTTPRGQVGPHVHKLAAAARQCRRFSTSADLDVEGQRVDVYVSAGQYSRGSTVGAGYTSHQERSTYSTSVDSPNLGQGMLNLAKMWYRGKLDPRSVTVEATRSPVKRDELLRLATAAWCEVFAAEVPTAETFQQQQEDEKARQKRTHEEMLAELQGGPAGVKKWNARGGEQRRKAGAFRKADLSGKRLDGVELSYLDFQGACFDRASLKKATLYDCALKGASFREADLRGANLAGSKCPDATFEGARLARCSLRGASFRRAGFQKADLTRADFSHSDLCGADLSSAELSAATLDAVSFDEATRWPAGFALPEGLRWRGKGTDPRQAAAVAAIAPAGPLDFPAFLQRLSEQVEQSRLSKALAMLQAERFQLYSDVAADALDGVVKSQSNPGLVYSCRLTSGGHFGCCTQNLHPCGGLRGALCKHLLVLVIGLTKAGRLDPSVADVWVRASRVNRPAVDEEKMTATLLRYKSAEAGEIDWRPTETIPEDYYAL